MYSVKELFMDLVKTFEETHELVESCNNDSTLYLIPKGTINELTYNSKPKCSFRYSDHWSWYANVKKCSDTGYIQCYLKGFEPNNRKYEGGASEPILTSPIIGFTIDGYHYESIT